MLASEQQFPFQVLEPPEAHVCQGALLQKKMFMLIV